MFRKYHRRSSFLPFVIFRLLLSLAMFVLLFGGLYFAYKSFSSVDPLKLNLNSILLNIKHITPPQFAKYLPFPADEKSNPMLDKLLQIGVDQSNTQAQFSFILIADSHSDNVNLEKALNMTRNFKDVQFLIGLGDYTEVGTLDELKNAKTALDSAGIRYFLTPGDHDLWDSRDKAKGPLNNFKAVFGPSYQSFSHQNFKFIILYNSDNYSGIDEAQLGWLKEQLESAKNEGLEILILSHTPLFHPSSDHAMGRVEPKLKEQAKQLISLFSNYEVKKIFAGDAHLFSEYIEPESKLSMVTVGAITSERNLQLPRFARVWVYEDGEVKVEDVEIK